MLFALAQNPTANGAPNASLRALVGRRPKEQRCKTTTMSWYVASFCGLTFKLARAVFCLFEFLGLHGSQRFFGPQVKCIEDLREKREEVNRAILKEEEVRAAGNPRAWARAFSSLRTAAVAAAIHRRPTPNALYYRYNSHPRMH